MNIRQAILMAADSIEQNPKLFDFNTAEIPDCNTPGCALGWIAAHLGESIHLYGGWNYKKLARVMGTRGDIEFYERMNALNGHKWKHNADKCAKTLRLYADKYHSAPIESHAGIPAVVLEIFDLTRVTSSE